MHDYKRSFIEFLVGCEAFRLGSFKLKSGRISPTFVNTGLVADGPGILELGRAYAASILEHVGKDAFDSVFGPSYKGVPLAVATAVALAEKGIGKGYLFDRKEAKTHGEEAAKAGAAAVLVGHRPLDGERVVIVDDVMTTGGTKYEAVNLLRSLVPGVSFPALVIAVDREEVGADGIHAATKFTEDTGVPVVPTVTITEILDHLMTTDRLSGHELVACLEYLEEYGTPAAREWAHGLK